MWAFWTLISPCGWVPFQNQGSMDALNMDTVCRLYEVGRQRLAEDEDEEEDQVSGRGPAAERCLVLGTLLSAVGRCLSSFLKIFAVGVLQPLGIFSRAVMCP